jgi:hypothetical protein
MIALVHDATTFQHVANNLILRTLKPIGAAGRIRTCTGVSPRGILSPMRLPFRHGGTRADDRRVDPGFASGHQRPFSTQKTELAFLPTSTRLTINTRSCFLPFMTLPTCMNTALSDFRSNNLRQILNFILLRSAEYAEIAINTQDGRAARISCARL